MTDPDPAAGSARAVPDRADLALLAELINHPFVPVATAAWNARMSQAEAAGRLVAMAEQGLPLRLVAEGDREALWRIAQAGPATGAVATPAPTTGPVPAAAAAPRDATGAATAAATPMASARPGGPVPPPTPVPPHEQAISGAVPLGGPPFGPGPTDPAALAAHPASGGSSESPAHPEATPSPAGFWGIPGRADWARAEPGDGAPSSRTGDPAPDPAGPPATGPGPVPEPAADQDASPGSDQDEDPAPDPSSAASEPTSGSEPDPAGPASGAGPAGPANGAGPAPSPARPDADATPPGGTPAATPTNPAPPGAAPEHPVAGLFGEHLTIALDQVIDPADPILAAAGFRLDGRERSVLVHTVLRNPGPVDFESVADLYLALVDTQGRFLPRAPYAVPGYPPHVLGVRAGAVAAGWSLFQIPAGTTLAAVHWTLRPDLQDRAVGWSLR